MSFRLLLCLCSSFSAFFWFGCNTGDGEENNQVSPDHLHLFKSDNGFGYVDNAGSLSIENFFLAAMPFDNGFAIVLHQNGWGVIDETGDYLLDPQDLDFISALGHGAYWIQENDTSGYFWSPREKNEIVEGLSQIKEIESVQQVPVSGMLEVDSGVYVINVSGQWGVCDVEGDFFVQPSYDYIRPMSSGLSGVRRSGDGKWSVVNRRGEVLSPWEYDSVWIYQSGVAPAKIGDDWYILGQAGARLDAGPFGSISIFDSGIAAYSDKYTQLHGVLNSSGDIVVDAQYYWLGNPSEGFIAYISEDQLTSGYMDYQGNSVIRFDMTPSARIELHPFINGVAQVTIGDDVSGLIRKNGEWHYQEHPEQ